MQQTFSQALRSVTRLSLSSALFFVVILVFAAVKTVAQNPVPKNVTLQYRNASLKAVLRDIEKQTKYTFAISSDELENRRGVTVKVHNAPLNAVLPLLFPASRYSFEIRDGQIIVIPAGAAPNPALTPGNAGPAYNGKWTVTGMITDGMQPLSGVSIRETGTQNGTASKEDGTFTVDLASGQATLLVSLIGFQPKEITVRDRHAINIILQPDLKKLNELVVLGYGLQKRANITGAISQVEGNRLKSRPVPNVMAALQGTATGLVVTRSNGQPGKEGFNVQVRGVTGGSSNAPVIVDGVPGSLSVLNPDDIESVSILKDAAAAAIYGARGAGGVVLVTTRTGKPGKLSVDFNTLGGFERPIRLPQRLSSASDAYLENIAAGNAGLPEPWQPAELELLQQGNKYIIDPNHPDDYKYYYNYNQLALLTKDKTAVQNYNLSVKGGSETNQFTGSVGYFGRQGLFAVGPDKTSRINARFSLNNRFNKHFSLESRMSVAQSNTLSPAQVVEGPYGLLAGLYRGPGNVPVFVPETNHYAYGGSPVYAILQDGGKREERNNYIDAVFTLRADSLVKGLTLRLIYSPQKQTFRDDLGRQTVPLWNRVAPVASVQENNMLQKNRMEAKGGNLQLLGDYEARLHEKHMLHLLGGITQETYNTTQNTLASYGISPEEINAARFNGSPQYSRQLAITGSLTSIFTKLNYNFDNRLLLEANVIGARLYQGANFYPSVTQLKVFPSFSAGWRLNNETWFYEALPFFNEFKLRWSWGQLGNVNSWNTISTDERYQTFTFNPSTALQPFVFHNPLPQPTGWENIAASNFGWDAALFKGQLSLSADYFIRYNRDMQIPRLTSSATGAWPLSYHEGEMRSEGWEINAGWKSNTAKAFNWYLHANLLHNKNKVLKSEGVFAQPGWNQGVPGYAYSSLFGYQAEGYFHTETEVRQHAWQSAQTAPGDIKYKDINGDHIIDNRDLVYLGTTDPLYSYGVDAGISWKGIELSVFFQGVGNRRVMPDPRYNLPFTTGWQEPWSINQDFWRPENPDAAFPRLYKGPNGNTLPSSHWVMNGAYIRLKNLQLGYSLPPAVLKHLSIKQLRIYFSGQDLWETNNMKIKYYDPEQAGGYNGNVYPFFRSYTLGLNVSF